MIRSDIEFQISAYCTEVDDATIDAITEVGARAPRGGYYHLFKVETSKDIKYFIAVTSRSSLNVFPATDEQIEEIFGYEAVPDRSSSSSRESLPS